MAKPVLGRGLGALLGGVSPNTRPSAISAGAIDSGEASETVGIGDRVHRVPIGQVRASPFQPRREFSPESLRELADSIREQGILQPLIVRQVDGNYELIAGERRWRAAQSLEMGEVPVIVRDVQDEQVLEMALIENLQRDNLNPLEEALGYSQLMRQFGLRQEDVAEKVGKSRAAVANALRLLRLPEEVQSHLRVGRLSVGHAKVILSLEDAQNQILAVERILKNGLNVRQTEELVANLASPAGRLPSPSRQPGKSVPTDTHVADLENRLQERFGTKVKLHYRQGKGYVQIRLFSEDDLERVLQVAGVSADA